jgi:hypothetical protein
MTADTDDPNRQRILDRERRRAERRRLLMSGPPSPCVSICRLDDATGYCVGCLRHRRDPRLDHHDAGGAEAV